MHNRPSIGFLIILLISLLVASCSSEQDQRSKMLKGIVSWTASAEMIVAARTGGEVPEAYSGLAIARCQQEVASLIADLAGLGAVPKAVEEIQPLLQHAADAALTNDRAGAERTLEALRHARSVIETELRRT